MTYIDTNYIWKTHSSVIAKRSSAWFAVRAVTWLTKSANLKLMYLLLLFYCIIWNVIIFLRHWTDTNKICHNQMKIIQTMAVSLGNIQAVQWYFTCQRILIHSIISGFRKLIQILIKGHNIGLNFMCHKLTSKCHKRLHCTWITSVIQYHFTCHECLWYRNI